MKDDKNIPRSFQIEYPSVDEIQAQKETILEKSFPSVRRLSFRYVFYGSEVILFISIMIYFVLMYFCSNIGTVIQNDGFLAMLIYPVTYFSFYLMSIYSEEQNDVSELKQTMRYSFIYLVNARMFYTSIAAILLNTAVLPFFLNNIGDFWSIGAVGASAMFIMALLSLIIYRKTGSAKMTLSVFVVWILVCCVLLKAGMGIYIFITETVPIAVHISVLAVTAITFLNYVGKAEKQYAYNF